MSMVPTTEQRIAALEAEAGRLRHERDEARGLAKRFMLERNHLIEGIRDSIVALGLRSGALDPIDLVRTILMDLLDGIGDDKETVEEQEARHSRELSVMRERWYEAFDDRNEA